MKSIAFGRTAMHFLKPAASIGRIGGSQLRDYAAHPL
jgi:hypothetical protein